MSNLEREPDLVEASNAAESRRLITPRKVSLHTRSGAMVNRTLPHRELPTIGPWCFIDQFGPVLNQGAMRVAAHPHTGLQTVTWLFSGSVLHQDSLGSESIIRPNELNLMTAGHGVAHTELSVDSESTLHGVQLWVALPENARNSTPTFQHLSEIPTLETSQAIFKVFAGSFAGVTSPAKFYTDIVGVQVEPLSSEIEISLTPGLEYGLLVINGTAIVDGQSVNEGELLFLGVGADSLKIIAAPNSLYLLLGGAPLNEPIVMWWNFIGRSHKEIVEMREAWESHSNRFPEFENVIGERIPAPQLPNIRLTAR